MSSHTCQCVDTILEVLLQEYALIISVIESKFETTPITISRKYIPPFAKLLTIICETLILKVIGLQQLCLWKL